MKISAWVSVGDLVPNKSSLFERFFLRKFVYQSFFSKKDPKEVLLSLKKNKVDGVELLLSSNTKQEELQKISRLVTKLEMQIFSVHQPLSKLFNIRIHEIRKLSQITKYLNARVLVLHINVIGKQIFSSQYIRDIKNLEKEYSIKIGIENSPKSVLTIFKSYYWKHKKFSKLMQENNLNITFDTTHLSQVRGDIVEFYRENKERIVNIHISDYRKNRRNTLLLMTHDTHLPLGKGQAPIKNLLKELSKNNYKGLITMEINENLEDICQSARIIKNTI